MKGHGATGIQQGIRALARESFVRVDKLIEPLFLIDGKRKNEEIISSMPGISRMTEDKVPQPQYVEKSLKLGHLQFYSVSRGRRCNLKDKHASYSYTAGDCFYLRTIRAMKQRFPEAVLISDVALDPYSSDGHDGIVRDGKILNDETLDVLGKMSLAQAEAGIDIIGPSDMMDGRVGFLREALDTAGFTANRHHVLHRKVCECLLRPVSRRARISA
jgi:porphobilinogen synthase